MVKGLFYAGHLALSSRKLTRRPTSLRNQDPHFTALMTGPGIHFSSSLYAHSKMLQLSRVQQFGQSSLQLLSAKAIEGQATGRGVIGILGR